MAGQRETFFFFFHRSITVYIPGMDEKAKGGKEGEAGLVIEREDMIPALKL